MYVMKPEQGFISNLTNIFTIISRIAIIMLNFHKNDSQNISVICLEPFPEQIVTNSVHIV